jgi:hypothetical protein
MTPPAYSTYGASATRRMANTPVQSYINEYAWRYNERSNTTRSMLETLLDKAAG